MKLNIKKDLIGQPLPKLHEEVQDIVEFLQKKRGASMVRIDPGLCGVLRVFEIGAPLLSLKTSPWNNEEINPRYIFGDTNVWKRGNEHCVSFLDGSPSCLQHGTKLNYYFTR